MIVVFGIKFLAKRPKSGKKMLAKTQNEMRKIIESKLGTSGVKGYLKVTQSYTIVAKASEKKDF